MLNKAIPLALLAVLALVAVRQVLSSGSDSRTEVFPSSTAPEESITIPGTSGVQLPDVTVVDLNSRVTASADLRNGAGSTSTSSPTTSSSTTGSSSSPSSSSTTSSATTSSSSTSLTITVPTTNITLPTTNITITLPTTSIIIPTTTTSIAPPPTVENGGDGGAGGN